MRLQSLPWWASVAVLGIVFAVGWPPRLCAAADLDRTIIESNFISKWRVVNPDGVGLRVDAGYTIVEGNPAQLTLNLPLYGDRGDIIDFNLQVRAEVADASRASVSIRSYNSCGTTCFESGPSAFVNLTDQWQHLFLADLEISPVNGLFSLELSFTTANAGGGSNTDRIFLRRLTTNALSDLETKMRDNCEECLNDFQCRQGFCGFFEDGSHRCVPFGETDYTCNPARDTPVSASDSGCWVSTMSATDD
ncbi:MAG: hypothetical protein QNJ22_15145 [Desulfosarcinaceae bacterium]|nr:hypothetical protein [Desulfosarcinaceae bacterium]